MKNILLIAFLIYTSSATAQFKDLLKTATQSLGSKGLSTDQVAQGLKDALTQGASIGADALSQADGYFKNPAIKIPFPPDAKKMEDKLRAIGLGSEVDRFILTLNRGAEDAAKQAKPIFVNAIKQMSIQDAGTILRGAPDAATQYLKEKTTAQLQDQFKPVIKASLDKVDATKYYGELAKTYNNIPFVKKVTTDLDAYATSLAIDGLFHTIANEEKNIRANPAARTTDLLKKVFGLQK